MTKDLMVERCRLEGHKYEEVRWGYMNQPALKRCKWCSHEVEYLRHCCGSQGFGLGYGDYCPACDASRRKIDEDSSHTG